MSLHNSEDYNDAETVAALIAHGLPANTPSQLADAFRLGRASAAPDWKPQRCAECNCRYGEADCNWIKPSTSTPHNSEAE